MIERRCLMKKWKFLLLFLLPLAMGIAGCDSQAETPGKCKHEFGEIRITQPATCEKNGIKKKTCKKCGYVEAEIIDKLEHDYEEIILKEATCTEAGEKEYVCRNDSTHAYTEEIPALGHDWTDGAVEKEATCTEDGISSAAQCKKCGAKKEASRIPALGHDFNASEQVTKEATCTEDGEKAVFCTHGCGTKQTEKIPALGHHLVGKAEDLAQPDCVNPGKRKQYCDRCQKDVVTDIPALGHDMSGAGNVLTPATCSESGWIDLDCPRCKLKTSGELPALGHLYPDEYTVDVPATCEQAGHEIKVCMREGCDVVLAEKMTKSLGHSFSENGETRESECGGTITTYHCTREGCDGIKEEVTVGSEHEMGEYVYKTKSNCLEPSIANRTCVNCGYVETLRFAGFNFHSWNTAYTIGLQPTQSSDGYKYIACKTCGSEKSDSRVTLPRYTLDRTMKFEVSLCRTSLRPFNGEGTVHVYDGNSEVFQGKTENGSIQFSLTAKEYTVKVTDLPSGYTANKYTLSPSSAFFMLEVKASATDKEEDPNQIYKVGDLIGNLSFQDYEDKTYYVSDLLKQYKAIILDFYYTTCTVCNREFPEVVEAIKKYGDQVLVVFVNGHGESKDRVMSHAKSYGFENQIIAQKPLMDKFQGSEYWGFPTTVVIDSEGTYSEIIEGAAQGGFEKLMERYIQYAKTSGWGNGVMPEADLPQKRKLP